MTKAEQPTITQQDWRKHTALLQVKAFVDEMIEGKYNCSPHQYFMAAQGRAIDLKPVIDAAVATDPATSLAAQDGLVEALRKLSDAASTAIHFQHQKTNAMLELSTANKSAKAALSAIKGDKS